MIRHFYHILFAFVMAAALVSCEADLLDAPGGDIPDGAAALQLEMRFTPMEVARLSAGSRSSGMVFEGESGAGSDFTTAPGGASMDPVGSLVILVYNTENELLKDLSLTVDLSRNKPELEDREPADATNGQAAKEATYCVKAPVTLPYGNYKIFAVANV
ncbi:MAG: hypothetical protein K2L80_07290, partial [Muribaculaceae bacterium]|nr:hypothetical protein [Muribaculaceae bacterium]